MVVLTAGRYARHLRSPSRLPVPGWGPFLTVKPEGMVSFLGGVGGCRDFGPLPEATPGCTLRFWRPKRGLLTAGRDVHHFGAVCDGRRRRRDAESNSYPLLQRGANRIPVLFDLTV